MPFWYACEVLFFISISYIVFNSVKDVQNKLFFVVAEQNSLKYNNFYSTVFLFHFEKHSCLVLWLKCNQW